MMIARPTDVRADSTGKTYLEEEKGNKAKQHKMP
jgi:hypothetical protein